MDKEDKKLLNFLIGAVAIIGIYAGIMANIDSKRQDEQIEYREEVYQRRQSVGIMDCTTIKNIRNWTDEAYINHVVTNQYIQKFGLLSISKSIVEDRYKTPLSGSFTGGLFLMIGGIGGSIEGGAEDIRRSVFVNVLTPNGSNMQELPVKDVYIKIRPSSTPNLVTIHHLESKFDCKNNNRTIHVITIPSKDMIFDEDKNDMWKKSIGAIEGR